MLLDPYQFQTVKILQVIRESSDAVSVQLDMPSDYTYKSGQHAVVRVKVGDTKLTRQYSFSSAPSSRELWLTIIKTPDGAVSSWFVEEVKIGDDVEISKPFTGPLMQENPRGKLCMIAGGSGISPLMSRLREHRLANESPISLLYSTRSSNRCFEKELIPLLNEQILVHLSNQHGRLTKQAVKTFIGDVSTIYICGSRSFVQTMCSYCHEVNPEAVVFSESFTLE